MDWKTKFSDHLLSVKDNRFKWGKQDCCMFAANCIQNICGVDILEEYRGQYSTEDEAQVFIDEKGGTLSKFLTQVCRKYKLSKVHPKKAQNGSLCLVNTDIGDTAGILWNGKVWAQGPKGVITAPKSYIKRAWSLPKETK